ncbi:MAG: CHAD domain-containing protein [Candidatus Binataceae bacterium]
MEAETPPIEAPEAPVEAPETSAVAPAPEPAPRPAPPPKLVLTPEETLAASATSAIAYGRFALERHHPAAAAGETEPIHQLRVATRRLRATLQLFASITHAGYVNTIERDLTWMAQAAGAAREREITAGALRERAAKLDPAVAESLATIYATLDRERSEKLAQLRKVLASRHYRTMLARLDRPRLRKTGPDAILGVNAFSMLRPIARAAAHAGAELNASSPPATIHRLRVRVKRLRYAIEMLSALGGKRCRRLLARLEELQELLGSLNDVSVAIVWLIGFPHTAGVAPGAVLAAGAMAQSLRNRSAKLARRCIKAWRKLEKSGAIADALDEIRRQGKETPVSKPLHEEPATVNAA